MRDFFGENDALIDEILRMFATPARATYSELASATMRRQPERVRGAAHKLLSAARTIGAGTLGDLCLDIELLANSGQWIVIELLLASAGAELSAVIAFIESATAEPRG